MKSDGTFGFSASCSLVNFGGGNPISSFGTYFACAPATPQHTITAAQIFIQFFMRSSLSFHPLFNLHRCRA